MPVAASDTSLFSIGHRQLAGRAILNTHLDDTMGYSLNRFLQLSIEITVEKRSRGGGI